MSAAAQDTAVRTGRLARAAIHALLTVSVIVPYIHTEIRQGRQR